MFCPVFAHFDSLSGSFNLSSWASWDFVNGTWPYTTDIYGCITMDLLMTGQAGLHWWWLLSAHTKEIINALSIVINTGYAHILYLNDGVGPVGCGGGCML